MTRVLVTGATGFVGRVLCETLSNAGCAVRAAVRIADARAASLGDITAVGDLDANTDWRVAMRDVDVVIHAAARAHILRDSAANAALYWRTNVDGTRGLLRAATSCGVKRFIYLSSIKVNGEATGVRPFTADDAPNPTDDYGRSKLAAEQEVFSAATGGVLDAIVVRPPLVYGSGVRANFLRIMRWIDRGIPLPLGAVRNSRSMVSVWNLCDLLAHLASRDTSHTSTRTFLVSDGEDLATPELVRRLAIALDVRPRLFAVPVGMLKLGASVLGVRGEAARLCGSLQVDITATRRELGWAPPLTVDEGLRRTARWFEAHRDR